MSRPCDCGVPVRANAYVVIVPDGVWSASLGVQDGYNTGSSVPVQVRVLSRVSSSYSQSHSFQVGMVACFPLLTKCVAPRLL